MKIRVYYEDTDIGGIVYHTNYIKYCERARSEYFFSQGIMPGIGAQSGFVVRRITADYLNTATLGDLLDVESSVLEIKNSSVVLMQEILKEKQKIFFMEVILVYVENGKPSRIPDDFKKLFKNFQ